MIATNEQTGNLSANKVLSQTYQFLSTTLVFAGIMAFATGTSWGTFAILMPIAVPLALSSGLPPEFLGAAVLGGGIFGDHSSPISDSTIIASLASGCDHIEHVKTQLPYNVVAAALAMIGYLVMGYYLIGR